MFRLAHISDIHLGPLPALSIGELASKRLTGFVNWHRNRRKLMVTDVLESVIADLDRRGNDHLAITGDLTNLTTMTEIIAARAWLETLGDPHDVSVVPGNHDAYVPGAYEKVCKAWRPWMRGDTSALEGASAEPAMPAGSPAQHGRPFPYMRVRGKVALIGISTAHATPPFLASGYFGRTQAHRAIELMRMAGEAGLFRVVMIHHPPIRNATEWHKRLIGIGRFAAAASLGGAELVLHGHTHLDTLNWLPLRNGLKVPVVGIASASQGPGGRKPLAGYNLFEIDGEPGNWTCRRQRYQFRRANQAFALAEENDLETPRPTNAAGRPDRTRPRADQVAADGNRKVS